MIDVRSRPEQTLIYRGVESCKPCTAFGAGGQWGIERANSSFCHEFVLLLLAEQMGILFGAYLAGNMYLFVGTFQKCILLFFVQNLR